MSGLSKEYDYTILCEDKQDQSLIRNFLHSFNISNRDIICIDLPKSGSGEQYVREAYPSELKKLRSSHKRTALLVCTDADSMTVEQRMKTLDDGCREVNIENRKEKDPVMLFIPKRNIETWINLIEEPEMIIDEDRDYGHFTGNESEKGKTGKKLAKMAIEQMCADNILSSLRMFQLEYNRLVDIQENGL